MVERCENLGNLLNVSASPRCAVDRSGTLAVSSLDSGYDAGRERLALTGIHAALVELGGDLRVGVKVEQAVDLRDSFLAGLPLLPRPEGQGQWIVRCAPPLKRRCSVMSSPRISVTSSSNKPHHPFAFAIGRGRITPQLREAAGQRENRRTLLIIDSLPILFPLTFTKFLRFSQHLQLGIPIGLERIGYEPIVGIHPQISPACQLGFVTGSLHLLLAQSVGFLQARLQFLLHRECDFQRRPE